LSKKINATIVVAVMALSIFSVASFFSIPAASAQNSYGASNLIVFLQPGVPDPYNTGFSLTLGTLRLNPQVIASDVASQSEQNNFAVLMGSSGDLMFTVTVVSTPVHYIQIWLPPDFVFPTTKAVPYYVWTDITNDYGYIGVSVRGIYDAVGPGWTRVTIGQHAATFTGGFGVVPASPMNDYLTIQPGVYHIRFFDLTAPNTVGIYHFKIATDAGFIPVADFPIMIVKGEVNTAYVTGLIESNEAPAAVSNDESGMIMATGTTADGRTINGIDMLSPEDACPNLGNYCAEFGLNAVSGSGYYRYFIFGLPAGSYTINGTLSGDTWDTTSRFSVTAGQSFHLTANLGPGGGTVVTLHVFSKHGRGTIPWNCLWQPPWGTNNPNYCDTTHPRDIEVQLYNQAGGLVGFWGSNYYGAWTAELNNFKLPTNPAATDYTMALTDTRGLPALDWVGVPSNHADYVTGFLGGTNYNASVHVTGYVMSPDDAYQRIFTATGSSMTVEMDLRRSNWFVITAHEFDNLYPTTVAFAAVPTGTAFPVTPGTESGLAAYLAPSAATRALPNNDVTVIMEGWAEGWPGTNPTWDYGLTPGTYDIHLMAADEGAYNGPPGTITAVGSGIYYIRSGEPFTASIALCNSPSALSFRVRSITMGITLRSVDTEVPAHERPWTFPGAEIWINFLDSTGKVVASIDPTEYSWVYGLVQDNGNIGSPYDAEAACALGMTTCTYLPPGMHGLLTMTWAGMNPHPYDVINVGIYPTMLPPGQYSMQVYTFGYTMPTSITTSTAFHFYPVSVPDGGKGDIQADLVQGGMVRVELTFQKQLEKVPFNGFARVEVYDSSNKLVGANIYGMAQPNHCDTVTSTCYDPVTSTSYVGAYPDYAPGNDFKVVKGSAEGSNTPYPDGQRGYLSSVWYGNPSSTWAGWVRMDTGPGVPSPANRLQYDTTASAWFDVYGFHWYYGNPDSRNDGNWANGWETTDGTLQNDYGILGSRDTPQFHGGGLYTVKVFAFDPYGPDNIMGTADDWQSYYAGTAPTWAAVTGLEIPWGGGATVGITLNQLGRLSGTPTWLDMYGDMSFVPWATTTAESTFASGVGGIDASWGFGYSMPGYFVWLPAGTHSVSIGIASASQVFAPASSTVVVSDGWSGTYDVTLIPTGTPVPEFPATAFVVLLSALGASVYLLRRRKTRN
jgi:hypothetical protein